MPSTNYEFEDGEPLTPNERSPRQRNLNSDKFYSAATTDARHLTNFTSNPKPSYEFESNAMISIK